VLCALFRCQIVAGPSVLLCDSVRLFARKLPPAVNLRRRRGGSVLKVCNLGLDSLAGGLQVFDFGAVHHETAVCGVAVAFDCRQFQKTPARGFGCCDAPFVLLLVVWWGTTNDARDAH